MVINRISQVSLSGLYRVSPDEGAVFYVRQEYLCSVNLLDIECGDEFDEDAENEFMDAALAVAAEIKASDYLARAEQSRFGLERKLSKKGFQKKYVEMALNFLEEKGFLDDFRYASAWLSTRKINHFEGRTRLLAELRNRGIDEKTASAALKEFFLENDESEICRKAYQKFVRLGKKEEKLVESMIKAGFSYKMIQNVKKEIEEVI